MGRLRAPWGLFQRKYPDGRTVWWYYIYDADGIRHRVSTGQVTKAKALGEVTRRLTEGTAVPKRGITNTVEDYAGRIWSWDGDYIRNRLIRSKVTKAHVMLQASRFKNHINPAIGKMPIEEVTVNDLDKLFLDLSGKMAHTTVNLVYSACKVVWDEAYRTDVIKSNIFAKMKPLKADGETRNVLSLTEALSFLRREWWPSDMAWALNLVAATSGARNAEICALRVGDIQEDRIRIKATVRAREGLVEDTKTGEIGKRWSAIPSVVFQACKPFLNRDPKEFLFETTPGKHTGRHFPIDSLNEARDYFNGTHKESPIPEIVFHSWRHFVVSTLSPKCRPDSVSLHVGHAVPGVKGTYVHQTEEHIQECLSALNEVFSGFKPD